MSASLCPHGRALIPLFTGFACPSACDEVTAAAPDTGGRSWILVNRTWVRNGELGWGWTPAGLRMQAPRWTSSAASVASQLSSNKPDDERSWRVVVCKLGCAPGTCISDKHPPLELWHPDIWLGRFGGGQ